MTLALFLAIQLLGFGEIVTDQVALNRFAPVAIICASSC